MSTPGMLGTSLKPSGNPKPATPSPTATRAGLEADGRYLVKAGDRLERIAATYGVSVDDIMKANDLTDRNYIWTGQRLVIPHGRR